ncbi:hypothetical protein Kosp01_22990 [Kocuria sp. NBRC 114282]|nr:hypothetical protein Kosp01_22990 [Kocuria sp. NBRC 114282]
MPFLDRLNRWAAQRPGELAVACGDDRLSWGELRARAAALAASGEPTGILRQANATDFAVRWAAGVAEDRVCAVLDRPGRRTWPSRCGSAARRACRPIPPLRSCATASQSRPS